MNPGVSVVMAARNYGRYVAGAVESVFAQSYCDWELVVIEDGSTDDTPEVLGRYADDPRVTVVATGGVGQPRAKNLGVRLARAGVVAFLDADDLWHPEKLTRQLAVLDANPRVGVVASGRDAIDADGRPLSVRPARLHRGDVLAAMFRQNFVCFSSALVRKSALDHAGLFDETLDLAIDYDLWLRVASIYEFDHVDEPLVLYRTGHANLSARKVDRLTGALLIMERFLERGPGRLPASWVRLCRSETFQSLAAAYAAVSPARAAYWLARSAWEYTSPRSIYDGLRLVAHTLRHSATGSGGDGTFPAAWLSSNHPVNC